MEHRGNLAVAVAFRSDVHLSENAALNGMDPKENLVVRGAISKMWNEDALLTELEKLIVS